MMEDFSRKIQDLPREEIFLELLNKKEKFYKAILESEASLSDMLSLSVSIKKVYPLIKRKKVLMTCIADIDSALSPIVRMWNAKESYEDSKSQAVQKKLEALEVLLKKILEKDEENQKLFREHFFQVKAPS